MKGNRAPTPVECQVLTELAAGARRWDICRGLDCSEEVVDHHIASIWAKWLRLNGLRQTPARGEVRPCT